MISKLSTIQGMTMEDTLHDQELQKQDPAKYWQDRYDNERTGWDMGKVSPPLKAYFDSQLANMDKEIKILIAGAGNAYEAEYLHELGFNNVVVLDIAQTPLDNLSKKFPDFPQEHLVKADFFALDEQTISHFGQFDYAIEQTFFCAIPPDMRQAYVEKMHQLLKPTGKLVGLLWDCYFAKRDDDKLVTHPETTPPYGGNPAEYQQLFSEKFQINIMEQCHNSVTPRQGRELFIEMEKKV